MKKFALVLLVVGVLVMISPLIGKLYIQWQENRMLDEWYNSEDTGEAEAAAASENPEEAYGQLQNAFSEENVEDTSGTTETTTGNGIASGSAITGKRTAKPQVVLGIIQIDKIKIKYPIVEGVKASSLRRAIGHIPGTAGIGQPGNCALAGHRNYTFGRYFNRLDEVKEGDIISVSTKKAEYRYKVYEKLVVKPDDVSVIKGSKEDSVLTLITCTPIYVATHRLILHARLEETILLEP